ncbi:hypothetical protein Fmac_012099 [Flemingia macrophylla]|uniref:CASP-like protein n=1 Tax=Flemingia macrophylla TaxID=520843 RepID=A0ABD1MQ61_9FABA
MEEHNEEKMSVSNDSEMKIDMQPEPGVDHNTPETSGSTTSFLWRWQNKDVLMRGSLALRGITFFLSLISFILMASNKHGDWEDFEMYQEYRYLLAVAILSSLYTGVQVFRTVHELSTGHNLIQLRIAGLIDFVGDQVVAYFLISSTSSAIPITDRMREAADNIFTDSSAAAIAFSFLAFCCVALSAVISGHKLSTQTYI